jgi:hypothetical protein
MAIVFGQEPSGVSDPDLLALAIEAWGVDVIVHHLLEFPAGPVAVAPFLEQLSILHLRAGIAVARQDLLPLSDRAVCIPDRG